MYYIYRPKKELFINWQRIVGYSRFAILLCRHLWTFSFSIHKISCSTCTWESLRCLEVWSLWRRGHMYFQINNAKSLLSPPDSCPVLIASAKHKPSSWIHTITSCSELLSMFWWDIVILKQHLDRIKSRTNSLYVQFTTSVCLNTEMCPLVLVLFHTLLELHHDNKLSCLTACIMEVTLHFFLQKTTTSEVHSWTKCNAKLHFSQTAVHSETKLKQILLLIIYFCYDQFS